MMNHPVWDIPLVILEGVKIKIEIFGVFPDHTYPLNLIVHVHVNVYIDLSVATYLQDKLALIFNLMG